MKKLTNRYCKHCEPISEDDDHFLCTIFYGKVAFSYIIFYLKNIYLSCSSVIIKQNGVSIFINETSVCYGSVSDIDVSKRKFLKAIIYMLR